MHGALTKLSLDCDTVDVAGMSGYAFVVNTNPEVSPSGPVAFDWGLLVEGTQALGREIELVLVDYEGKMPAELQESMFERVRAEIDAGRPCVVWGAASRPAFALVHGYTSDSYLLYAPQSMTSAGGQDAQVPRELAANHKDLWGDGRVAGFFLGEQIPTDRKGAERKAIVRALKLLRAEHPCLWPAYTHGAAAFKQWAESVRQKRTPAADNVHNLACYAELQRLGSEFLRKLCHDRTAAAKELLAAATALTKSADNLNQLLNRLRSCPVTEAVPIPLRRDMVELLLECQNYNLCACQALSRAISLI